MIKGGHFHDQGGALLKNLFQGGARAPGAPLVPTPMLQVGHVRSVNKMAARK